MHGSYSIAYLSWKMDLMGTDTLAHKKVQLHIAQGGLKIILVASSGVLLSILASHSCTEYLFWAFIRADMVRGDTNQGDGDTNQGDEWGY